MKLFLNILLILFLPLTIYAIIQNTKGTTIYNVKAERFSPVEESETSDPYFKHIRRALDGYLNGTNDGISLPTFVVNPSTDSNGKIITIFFDKMPDKIFDCWVLKSAKGEYDLRGFWENNPTSSEQVTVYSSQFQSEP